jgi:hypothetical protein
MYWLWVVGEEVELIMAEVVAVVELSATPR